jgi:hypothetical protein
MEWLRFYVGTLDNPKVQGLPGGTFKAWVNCLCLARINDGVLPSVDVIAFRLRCSMRQAEQWRDDLTQRKLVDVMPDGTYRMHDWDQHQYVSDGSTERVRKHREKQRRNVSVTPPDTEQIQNRTETDSEPETQRTEVRQIRSPGSTEKRTSGDASVKAPMRSRLSRSEDLPANWTELDVSNLQEQLASFMDGDQPPADLTAWILHDLARKYSLSANEIRDGLQAAWHRNGAPGRKNAPREWKWFYSVLRNAFIPGYEARVCGP